MKQIARVCIVFGCILTGVLAVSSVVVPASAIGNGGASVQGYAADRVFDYGTIVKLEGDSTNRVTIATQADMQNMFGVTVDPAALPVVLKNDALENETFVAVSGTYNVLVSTQGGPISAGDQLTVSSINGVAMKAGTEESTVLGRAGRGFDDESTAIGKKTLADPESQTTKTVSIGSVPVTIEIQRNPNEISTKANVPEFLERVGQAVAEKEVSPIRMYLSLAITAISLLAAIVVLYAGVRNGVISIGRNPMSKKSIFRALMETILTSVLILQE